MGIKKYKIVTSLTIFTLVLVSSAYTLFPQKIKAASSPTLTTESASGITASEATLNGNMTSVGSESSLIRGFNYGTSTSYGQITSEQNGSGYGTGTFTKSISGLICGTTYHYRSYAVNSVGVGYGNDITFTTTATGTCTTPGSGNQPDPTTTNNTENTNSSLGSESTSISSMKSIGKVGFGGEVKLTTIPNVVCEGSGTIFVLSANLVGTATETATKIAGASGSDTQKTIKKASAIMKAISSMIPFYSTDSNKNPKVGDQIMGKANSIPDFSICKLQIGPYRIPFPVKKTTDNYNISRK